MKKLLTTSLVLTLALTLQAEAKSPSNKGHKGEIKSQLKSQKQQAKVYRHHESNWQQPHYGHHVILFKCRDSWGHKLRGKFTEEQQYFIELGGGSCRQARGRGAHYGALEKFYRYDIALENVYQAIDQIQYDYGLRGARLIEAQNISNGRRNFKYTLVFKSPGRGYREFRVKHNRWNGALKAIYEV